MFIVLAYMIAGIVVGYLMRRWKIRFIHRLILTLIWLLLFLLGLEVGANETVVRQFGMLGFEAFLLATGGTLGSVIAAWFLYKPLQPTSKGGIKAKISNNSLINKLLFRGRVL
jgi:uncharacterized membrane protein YbjE (DUF340 family)